MEQIRVDAITSNSEMLINQMWLIYASSINQAVAMVVIVVNQTITLDVSFCIKQKLLDILKS
jgi:hypothetical protein